MKYFNNIGKVALVALIIGIIQTFSVCFAGSFSVTGVDATKFPVMHASFVALDDNGKSFPNISASDFTIKDFGSVISPASVSISCIDTLINPELSVILVNDQSTSMTDKLPPDNDTRWDWVRYADSTFVYTLKFQGDTKVAVTTFSFWSWIRCKFSNNPREILDTIINVKVYGGTDYNPAFFTAPQTGFGCIDYMKTRDPKIRRVVIFLTDGVPLKPVNADSIIFECNNANIQVYGICVNATAVQPDIAKICEKTGGKSFAVATKKALADIYAMIAVEAQSRKMCDISWISPYGCDDQSRFSRTVDLTFKPLNEIEHRPYTAPIGSVAGFDLSTQILAFGDPNPLTSSDVTLVIKPKGTKALITGGQFKPINTFFSIVDWGGTAPPFTLDTNQSRTITLRFTQDINRNFQRAIFELTGTPCMPAMPAVGGLSQVLIVNPAGGEIKSSCDTVRIIWAGIGAATPINLYYSTDNGLTFPNLIVSNVTGFVYNWFPVPSGNIKIKAVVAPISKYMWANSFGCIPDEHVTGLAISQDNSYLYMCGSFTDSICIGSTTLRAIKGTDGFIAKFDIFGNFLWANSFGSTGLDSAAAICVDAAGYAYITGTVQNGYTFGGSPDNSWINGRRYMFVARYGPNGGMPIYNVTGATGIYTLADVWGTDIYIDAKGYLQAEGKYTGGAFIAFTKTTLAAPTPITNTKKFQTEFTAVNLSAIVSNPTGFTKPYNSNTALDANGNRFDAFSYTGTTSFGGTFNFTSKGLSDIILRKYGGQPGSADTLKNAVSVQSPQLSFTVPSVDLGTQTMGYPNGISRTGILKNIGNLTLQISSSTFSGINANEFSLASSLNGVVLAPNETHDVEFIFTPGDIGIRSAVFQVNSICGSPVFLNVSGTGICSGDPMDSYNFGDCNAGIEQKRTLFCALHNTNNMAITIKPTLDGAQAVDFRLYQADCTTPLTQLTLLPDSCALICVGFTPAASNAESATINYHLPSGCTNQYTNLYGKGVVTDLAISPIDWKGRRINCSFDSVLIVQNNGKGAADITITAIDFENGAIPEFAMTVPSLPVIVAANGGQLSLPVKFIPSAETNFKKNITFKIKEDPSKIYTATLSGFGIIPKITSYFDCPKPVLPGDTSTAWLTIKDTSASEDLTIYTVDFKGLNLDFKWPGGAVPSNITVKKLDSIKIPIIFAPPLPNGFGQRGTKIMIIHDAISCDSKGMRKDTVSYDIICDGLTLQADSVTFGSVYQCDNLSKNLSLHNQSFQTKVFINPPVLTGSDASAFKVNIPAGYSIDGGNSSKNNDLTVIFTPSEPRKYHATLQISNSFNQKVSSELNGSGEIFKLSTPVPKRIIQQKPGYKFNLPVFGDVSSLTKGAVTDFTMNLTYNPNVLTYVDGSIKSAVSLPSVTWTTKKITNGLTVTGNGSIPAPYNSNNYTMANELFDLDFLVYLSDETTTQVHFAPVLKNCTSYDTLASIVSVIGVCNAKGRLVEISTTEYYFNEISPSPSNDKISLAYGIGLDAATYISIYNSIGEEVKVLVNSEMKTGEYSQNVNLNELAAGIYFIRLQSGPFTETKRLIVNK
ncbi:MAG: choice-of-anchor D domain-containing protein [Candidatus Kapabacteria bacterium]|nr:choice-of-anchor D domain-containing protein [Candidatus Kapabacteria bacterium]